MARSNPEWIGRTGDSAIPSSVKDRVARGSDDCCVKCARKIGGTLKAEFDHAIPLILGGGHRESNLQLLCRECHAAKTRLDVKVKAKVARVRKKLVLGAKPHSGRSMPGSKQSRFKMKIGGGVVDRETGLPVGRLRNV